MILRKCKNHGRYVSKLAIRSALHTDENIGTWSEAKSLTPTHH